MWPWARAATTRRLEVSLGYPHPMTAQAATGNAEEQAWATIPDEPFESQGSRRRAQLVKIAASLIVTGGASAVTHASVAELAGVGRTAVYRYFPTREDILAAVLEAYSELHGELLTNEEVAAGILGLAASSRKRHPEATRTVGERLWDEHDWNADALKLRLAMCILVRDYELMEQLAEVAPRLVQDLDHQFLHPLRELGLTELERRVVTDAVVSAHYHASVAVLKGEIDRDQAADLAMRMNFAAVHAFL